VRLCLSTVLNHHVKKYVLQSMHFPGGDLCFITTKKINRLRKQNHYAQDIAEKPTLIPLASNWHIDNALIFNHTKLLSEGSHSFCCMKRHCVIVMPWTCQNQRLHQLFRPTCYSVNKPYFFPTAVILVNVSDPARPSPIVINFNYKKISLPPQKNMAYGCATYLAAFLHGCLYLCSRYLKKC